MRSTLSILTFAACLLGPAGRAGAQLPTAPLLQSVSTPEARLQLLEETYAANLRTQHAPILQDYLRQLEVLRSKFAATGRSQEIVGVDAEIASVRKAMAGNGVFPIASLLPGPPAAPAPASPAPLASAPSGSPPPKRQGTVMTLKASDAIGSTTAAGEAAKLTQLDWTITTLPAGDYEIAMLYACPSLEVPEQVTFSLAGQEHTQKVTTSRATGSEKDFRIMRLGVLKLEQDIGTATLTVHAAGTGSKLLVRSVIISRPKPNGPPPPPKP